jgi:alanine racemase
MLLGYAPLHNFFAAYKNDITLCVHSLTYAKELDALAKKRGVKVKCQVKLDTGMGRIGFDALNENIYGELKSLYALENLNITGIFSHFSSADGIKPCDRRYTKKQEARFKEILSFLKNERIDAGLTHQANSAAALRGEYKDFTASRIGLGLYGLSPSPKFNALPIKPAMSLKAFVVFVKQVEKGRAVSYGRMFVTKRDTKIATVSVGYADGYDRRLSKGGVMGISGKSVPVIGKVTMDMVMLDASGAACKAGDTVTVLGENALTVAQAAKKLKTIPYEIICGISSRVKRIYTGK